MAHESQASSGSTTDVPGGNTKQVTEPDAAPLTVVQQPSDYFDQDVRSQTFGVCMTIYSDSLNSSSAKIDVNDGEAKHYLCSEFTSILLQTVRLNVEQVKMSEQDFRSRKDNNPIIITQKNRVQ